MIALYIILGILLFISLLLMLRLRITVSYQKVHGETAEPAVYLGIGPAKIKLYPKKEKSPNLSDFSAKKYRRLLESDKTAKPKETKPEKQKKKNEALPGGIGETFELVLELVEKFRGRLRCEILRLTADVATDDAAKTAYVYSAVSSAAMFLIEAIDSYTVLRLKSPKDVRIGADFDHSDYSCDIGIKFSIRIIGIISGGWGFIKNYFRTLIRLENQNK